MASTAQAVFLHHSGAAAPAPYHTFPSFPLLSPTFSSSRRTPPPCLVVLRSPSPPSTATTVAATAAVPLPVSPSGIVLVDPSDAEKVHRLKTIYLERIVPSLRDEFSYTNIHQVPKLEKIVVNCGIRDAQQNAKDLEAAMNEVALITGQKPVKTRAKVAIAAFKIREGSTVGIAVTLRRKVMYSFLDRLINLALPRTTDFEGVSLDGFDGHGNYSIGLEDRSVFPEIDSEPAGRTKGMHVCITTTAKTDDEAHRLLTLLGMPFREGAVRKAGARKKKKKPPPSPSRY